MIQSRPNEFQVDEPAADAPGTEPKDRLKQHGEDVKRQADEIRQQAGDMAQRAGESLKEVGRTAKDQVVATARQATGQVQDRASTALSGQKDRLAEQVGVLGQALHRAAETLDENQDQALGRYAHQAGDLLDSCADYLRRKDAAEMVRGVGDFTRRHPEVVLGGLFLAGVAVARFLKASNRNVDRGYEGDYGYDYGYMDSGRGLESGDEFRGGYGNSGYADTGYGDIGMYAGSDVEPYGMNPPFGATGGGTLGRDVAGDADLDDISGEVSGLAPRSREFRGQIGDADMVPDLPREEASLTRNQDIPDVTSPQPGSYPPVTPSGTFFESTSGQAGKTNPTATTADDDLGTIGRNDPTSTNPNRPR